MKKTDGVPHLRERDVSRQLKDFLEWRGWRVLRNNVTKVRDYTGQWTQYGEPGMPDYLALYYVPASLGNTGAAAHLWLEVKQKGGRLRPDQKVWHTRELSLGACVFVADEFEAFEKWYWEEFGWLHSTQGQTHLFAASTRHHSSPPSPSGSRPTTTKDS